jgi:hypothetical protein
MSHFDALISYTGQTLDLAEQAAQSGHRDVALTQIALAEGLLRQACQEAINSVTDDTSIKIVEH